MNEYNYTDLDRLNIQGLSDSNTAKFKEFLYNKLLDNNISLYSLSSPYYYKTDGSSIVSRQFNGNIDEFIKELVSEEYDIIYVYSITVEVVDFLLKYEIRYVGESSRIDKSFASDIIKYLSEIKEQSISTVEFKKILSKKYNLSQEESESFCKFIKYFCDKRYDEMMMLVN